VKNKGKLRYSKNECLTCTEIDTRISPNKTITGLLDENQNKNTIGGFV